MRLQGGRGALPAQAVRTSFESVHLRGLCLPAGDHLEGGTESPLDLRLSGQHAGTQEHPRACNHFGRLQEIEPRHLPDRLLSHRIAFKGPNGEPSRHAIDFIPGVDTIDTLRAEADRPRPEAGRRRRQKPRACSVSVATSCCAECINSDRRWGRCCGRAGQYLCCSLIGYQAKVNNIRMFGFGGSTFSFGRMEPKNQRFRWRIHTKRNRSSGINRYFFFPIERHPVGVGTPKTLRFIPLTGSIT